MIYFTLNVNAAFTFEVMCLEVPYLDKQYFLHCVYWKRNVAFTVLPLPVRNEVPDDLAIRVLSNVQRKQSVEILYNT